MVDYYLKKIKKKIINPKTSEPWTIEDVPTLWREEVRKLL